MDLLSVFKRKAPPETADAVQLARTRARQRLIGAAVLVIIGIIGFPLLFETQPRPISVDLPIDIPRKDNAPPLAMPSVLPASQAASAAPPARVAVQPAAVPARAAPPADPVITETQADAGREVAPSASAPASAAPVAPAKPAAPAAARASVAAAPASRADDGARAQALLEGKPASAAAAAPRYVVQIGSFADAAAARETRAKAEKLGLKTYTHVAETANGPRTRVRVGPFATHDEAARAAAKLKAAALPTAILTL